jgi:hypothetical protein
MLDTLGRWLILQPAHLLLIAAVNLALWAACRATSMATFTVAKGGLMYEAVLAGQKFSYKAR